MWSSTLHWSWILCGTPLYYDQVGSTLKQSNISWCLVMGTVGTSVRWCELQRDVLIVMLCACWLEIDVSMTYVAGHVICLHRGICTALEPQMKIKMFYVFPALLSVCWPNMFCQGTKPETYNDFILSCWKTLSVNNFWGQKMYSRINEGSENVILEVETKVITNIRVTMLDTKDWFHEATKIVLTSNYAIFI